MLVLRREELLVPKKKSPRLKSISRAIVDEVGIRFLSLPSAVAHGAFMGSELFLTSYIEHNGNKVKVIALPEGRTFGIGAGRKHHSDRPNILAWVAHSQKGFKELLAYTRALWLKGIPLVDEKHRIRIGGNFIDSQEFVIARSSYDPNLVFSIMTMPTDWPGRLYSDLSSRDSYWPEIGLNYKKPMWGLQSRPRIPILDVGYFLVPMVEPILEWIVKNAKSMILIHPRLFSQGRLKVWPTKAIYSPFENKSRKIILTLNMVDNNNSIQAATEEEIISHIMSASTVQEIKEPNSEIHKNTSDYTGSPVIEGSIFGPSSGFLSGYKEVIWSYPQSDSPIPVRPASIIVYGSSGRFKIKKHSPENIVYGVYLGSTFDFGHFPSVYMVARGLLSRLGYIRTKLSDAEDSPSIFVGRVEYQSKISRLIPATPRALADSLSIDLRTLWYLSFMSSWRVVKIPKKGGGVRILKIPGPITHVVLQRLSRVLEPVDSILPEGVLGFRVGGNQGLFVSKILEKASGMKNPVIIKIDLKDFFSQTTADRIRTALVSGNVPGTPITPNRRIADIISKLVTDDHGILPQGAPTSPRISNIAFLSTDYSIGKIAHRYGAYYFRWADDITLLVERDVADDLLGAVRLELNRSGWKINEKKVRIMEYSEARLLGLKLHAGKIVPPKKTRRFAELVIHIYEKYGINGLNKLLPFRTNLISARSELSYYLNAIGEINKRNPDKVRQDRYEVLKTALGIISSISISGP